jgi:ferrous iron transport protein B
MANILRPGESGAPAAAGGSLTVALAGNPNAGKTTLFNALTGARQHVGNYPGVTVETFQGVCTHGSIRMNLVDLPGTYSLTAYSPEERVARTFLIHERPDVVIDVVDATNLERNLYLAVQILELGLPLVLALNMSDLAARRGIAFDLTLLQALLGAPIIPTVGKTGEGKTELLDAVSAAGRRAVSPVALHIAYGEALDAEIAPLQQRLEALDALPDGVPARWLAVKLLEGDADLAARLARPEIVTAAAEAAHRLEALVGDSAEALIADRRYGFISGACQAAVRHTVERRHEFSDTIDAVVTDRLFGLPIFLGLMYLVFTLTFTLGEPPMRWIEAGFGELRGAIGGLWPASPASLLRSLLINGIIGGVGGVLVFLPNILLLFLAIAILEDSGYMARAAFLMDRIMHKMGLHGKSFMPMLIGFGCSVPAILATRTLESRRDRLTTMLVVPLMSCGARLPIYALIIPAFFPEPWHGPMLWSIYLIGIALAVLCAKLLKSTLLRGETPPFVMELPPYRMPTLRSLSIHLWNRGGAYLKKAGTVILGISILLWAMQQWPGIPAREAEALAGRRAAAQTLVDGAARTHALAQVGGDEAEAALRASLMGRLGRGLEPVLRPCGFDWKLSTAMIGALAAKEVFVTQMGIIYALGGDTDEASAPLREKIRTDYTPLAGFCVMLFCLISAPCMATIAVTRRESGSWRWALLQLGGLTLLAWVVTAAVFQVGSLLGIGI